MQSMVTAQVLLHQNAKVYHIETSQLICRDCQLTDFYVMETLALNE